MKQTVLVLAALLLLSGAATVSAQSGGPFTLTWDTIVAGGGISTGGAYTLSDRVGRPDAGISSGGAFTLTDDFSSAGGGSATARKVYLPTVLRNR